MKILFLNEYAYPHNVSGAEYSTSILAEALAYQNKIIILSPNLGTQSTIIRNKVLYRKFPFLKKIKPGQVLSPFWFNNPLFWLYSSFWIIKTIKAEKIDLMHVHGKYIQPAAIIARWFTRVPVVTTVRDFKFLCPLALCFTNQQGKCSFSYYLNQEISEYRQRYHPTSRLILILAKLWQYVLKWFLLKSTKVIAISPELKEIYQNSGVNNIISIFNLPPIKFLSKKAKYKIQNKKIIISAGKLSYGKGTDTLLKAMNLIRGRLPNVILLLAGEINVSLKTKFPKNVKYLGKLSQEEIQSLYQSADLFIMLSRWPEPFGRVALDALVAGLPIIASNRGACKEFIEENGYLVNPDSPIEVADKIEKIFNHKNIDLLKKNSLKLLHTRFDRGQIIQSHLNLYQSL